MNGSVNVPGFTEKETKELIANLKKILDNHRHLNESIRPHSVEFAPAEGSKHGGFIDFHNVAEPDKDYTSRIIEHLPGVLTFEVDDKAVGTIPAMKKTIITLRADGWTELQQEVTVEGVTEDNAIFWGFAPASCEQCEVCNVDCTAQGNGTLTFTCDSTPPDDNEIYVVILT